MIHSVTGGHSTRKERLIYNPSLSQINPKTFIVKWMVVSAVTKQPLKIGYNVQLHKYYSNTNKKKYTVILCSPYKYNTLN